MSENNDNISLDEMMRNLKRGEVKKKAVDIESGKRVVRADGSEAIKVRTKKRRSVQPKEEAEQKSAKRKIILIVSVISLLLLSMIAYSVFLGYYNGSKFKSDMHQSVVNISGANAEIGTLDVGSTTSSLSKIQLTWNDEGSVLKEFNLSTLVADWGVLDMVSGGFGNSTVGILDADLKIELSDSFSNLNISNERPFDYPFSLYQCSLLNIDFGGSPHWSFENGSVSYRPNKEESGNFKGQFSVDRGDFKIPIFGEFKVRNGLIELDRQQAKVYLGLESEEYGGKINIDGVSGYVRNSSVDFKTKIKDYVLKGLLEPKTRRFFHGHVESGEGIFKMNIGDLDGFEMSSKLIMRDVRLTDFPFIRSLADLVVEGHYANPALSDKLSMTLRRSKKVTEFVDIDFKQEDFMWLKGDLSINELNLVNGELKLGIPVTFLSGKNGKLLRSVFADDDGEFIWTTVKISGDLSVPKDDFSQQVNKFTIKSDEQIFDDLLNR